MAKTYTAAGSATAGDVYTATAHNVIVTDVNNFIVPPLCRVRRATTQTITNNTDTFVSWVIEDIDTDGMFAATSDTITIQTAGVYHVSCSIVWSGNATGNRVLNICKSPSSTADQASVFAANWGPSTSERAVLCASGIVSCSVSDTIKVFVYQSSGTDRTIGDTSFSGATQCSVQWIGRTS